MPELAKAGNRMRKISFKAKERYKSRSTHKSHTNYKSITKKPVMLFVYLKKGKISLMKNKKNITQAFLITAFLGVMAGCGTGPLLQDENTAQITEAAPELSREASPVLAAAAEDGEKTDTYEIACGEQFKIYEPFGMVYDADRNELYYKGKAVRWFEDYYPLGDGSQAGRDFFNENGVVDVYAIRDLHISVRADDGSFDPSGTLTGLAECSEEEFAARDLEAIQNPSPVVAQAGDPATEEELKEMAEEYEAFGLTYDTKEDQWYYHGEKVRYFRDILTSNGEDLSSGKFHGAMRTFGDENGTVDIYTVRDYEKPNASGYGTLTGIERCTLKEAHEHSQRNTVPQSGRDSAAVEKPGIVDMAVYEPYGLIFDKEKDCYTYNGSIVRYFNDWRSGAGFTNFSTGTVDIEGAYDDNGNLIGIKECSREMYDFHTKKRESLFCS